MPSNVLEQLAAEVLAATGSEPESAPQLPTVGRIVHYWNRSWDPDGPYPAIVSGVDVVSETTQEIKAKIDLTIFGNNSYHLIVLREDVPVGPSEGVNLAHWWAWPARS